MSDYIHGAYGEISKSADSRAASKSRSAIVYIGTAPVHLVQGGASNVNNPILVNNIAEARRYFGYSDDFAKYTLCEAMRAHFELKNVGPLVFINVFNPTVHKAVSGGAATLTPVNGRIVIPNAESIYIDSLSVKDSTDDETVYALDTDYTASYNAAKKTLTLTEIEPGGLGTNALHISWTIVDATKVTSADVIGEDDGEGLYTGVHAVNNVYQMTGHIPSFLLAPGFSGTPAIHAAMLANASKINGHWDAYLFCDLPLVDGEGEALTLSTAAAFKNANGYNNINETVYFPLAKGTDGMIYHLSTLAAANFQQLLEDQDGIPYKTASNTDAEIIENLYLGASVTGRVYDDTLINKYLNKHGIASAAFVGGRWAIWGFHSAEYGEESGDQINVSETNRMMLFYISNDFQHRRTKNVDKPMTANDIKQIVSEEQARLDALVKIGALTFGECHPDATGLSMSDVVAGDFKFAFRVTTTPLAKSLTAIVNWTSDGFKTYFESFVD